jgi:hypothetical protein
MERSGIQVPPASPVVCSLDSAALHTGYEQFSQRARWFAPWIPLRFIQATSSSASELGDLLLLDYELRAASWLQLSSPNPDSPKGNGSVAQSGVSHPL